MIANCGAMGLDWERLSLSGYMEALEAHNEANSGDETERGGGDPEKLAKVMAARLG